MAENKMSPQKGAGGVLGTQQSPPGKIGAKGRSPLIGVSTDEHDLSTGHGGSKFDASLMENNLGRI